MVRGLDHVVHVVRDLEAAGELYDLLGFTVGARNRHPWGTHNRIVQTPGFFVELLEVVEPDAIPPHGETTLSFGAFCRDYQQKNGQGLAFLVLEGTNPAADKAEFDNAGFGGFDLFDFSREAKRPDGSDVEVSFTLAFASDPLSPDAGFFTCTQHRPENFWAPDMQRHMNGTRQVDGVVLTAEDPAAHLDFLSAFVGTPFRRAIDGWHLTQTPRGMVEVMTPELYKDRFGVAAPDGPGLRLSTVRFAVADIDATRRRLASSRMTVEEVKGVIVVGPTAALGATLVFEPVES